MSNLITRYELNELEEAWEWIRSVIGRLEESRTALQRDNKALREELATLRAENEALRVVTEAHARTLHVGEEVPDRSPFYR